MGTIVLIIAFVIEAAFAAYCIVTKSNHKQVRSYIRIGVLTAFVLFTLVSVIQWGFRWYALGALLSAWAALGAWTLIGKKAEKKGYKPGLSLVWAIATLLLVVIAVTPALIFPQHRVIRVTGKHEVATASYSYTDQSRIETFTKTGENRKVNVEFWYPRDGGDGTYPLVVFSHGSGGLKTSNASTFEELASSGYVVCSIDHPYHSLFTIGTDKHLTIVDPAYMQEYVNFSNGSYGEADALKLEHKWMDLRTADINFVLDTILAQTQDTGSDPVYQLIDPEKIGLMGHSLGGESVAQVARERSDINAVINLDADLGGEYLDYVNGKYVMNSTVYPVPILTILSDDLMRGIAAIPDADAIVAVQHVTATAPHAYEVHFAGTNHMSLTDLPIASPIISRIISSSMKKVGVETADKYAVVEKLNATALSFFNAYLKGEGSFTAAGLY